MEKPDEKMMHIGEVVKLYENCGEISDAKTNLNYFFRYTEIYNTAGRYFYEMKEFSKKGLIKGILVKFIPNEETNRVVELVYPYI